MRPASDTLSATFFALADPTRRAILSRLAEGPATVKELSAPFRISGPAVSKHLRILERAGEFRRFWEASYNRLDEYLKHLKQQEQNDDRN